MNELGRHTDANSERDLERDPSHVFRLSVVVPAHNAESDLPHCLDALAASDLPRDNWELILVDDSPGRGPAYARNRGIESSAAAVVAFVDADVTVHRNALRLMLERIESGDADAVFGSYDDAPSEPGLVSQYRNLLHHFIHQRAGPEVESFWAGCGAVKRQTLIDVGMFDEVEYRKPEIEDVELGYRLRDARHRIVLDPRAQCTHRKRWTLRGMITSDFSRRGVPWARLLARRGMITSPRGLSLGKAERLSAVTALAVVTALLIAGFSGSSAWTVVAVAGIAGFLLASHELLGWLARVRGIGFALKAVPLHLIYNLVAVSALFWGTLFRK